MAFSLAATQLAFAVGNVGNLIEDAPRKIGNTPSDDWGLNLSVVFTGILIVFLILTILIAFMQVFTIIATRGNKSDDAEKKNEPSLNNAPNANITQSTANTTGISAPKSADNIAVIAAISAAISAFTDGKGTVLSATPIAGNGNNGNNNGNNNGGSHNPPKYRRAPSAWEMAGRLRNTQPF
ncbi:MAG: OadG family protein [Oscillospiraceae bacterium]|jgi:Na+-transporting methylmalonyl-CoA/oxaloacetate decarboxylase gamma subunit|nr:OadG family protein [Oscillospiraceae bacterium]